MQKIKLLLPAYNEENSLGNLLKRVNAFRKDFNTEIEVLVVNDGSKDQTVEVARSHQGVTVKVLDLQPNRGLAGAMRAGLTEAVKDMDDSDILVTMDADDSHNPALIYRMIIQIREGSDVVIASRYLEGSRIVGLSRFRKFLSSVARYMFSIIFNLEGVRDYTCGFRAYKVGILKKSLNHYGDNFIQQKGFGCMAEILLKMRFFEPVINELPFILRYDQKLDGSKMNIIKTVRQTLSLMLISRASKR